MTLNIDDHPAAAGKAKKLIARQPAEDFCAGHDNAKPLADCAGRAPFEGSITALKITTP